MVCEFYLKFNLDSSKNLFFFIEKVLKQCTLETVQEHLKMFDYVFTEAHEQAWNKFLSYIIEYMIEINGATRQSTESIMTSDIVSQQH